MRAYEPYVASQAVPSEIFIEALAEDAIKNPSQILLLESSFSSPFTKPSAYHGRRMEDPNNLVLQPGPVTDEYGNIYPKLTIKGADASLPSVSYYNIEPSEVRVDGMMDASTFSRYHEASAIMRGAGMLTEWPIYHGQPTRFPDGTTKRGIGTMAFKEMIYGNYVMVQEAARKRGGYSPSDSAVRAGTVGTNLIEMDFGVMYSGMLSNARLAELEALKGKGTLDKHVSEAMRALKLREPTHFDAWRILKDMDPETNQKAYIRHVLPSLMGQNLAIFQNTDSYHKYLHAGNWTLAGEIVDLDSVRNAAIDPEDAAYITVSARLEEVFYASTRLAQVSQVYNIPLSDLMNEFNVAFLAKRYTHPSVTELESILLESHMFIPSRVRDDGLGKPRIVKIPELQMMATFHAAIMATKTVDRGTGDMLFRRTVMNQLKPIANKQVKAYLEREGIDLRSWWLHPERLVELELYKTNLQFANAIEDEAMGL